MRIKEILLEYNLQNLLSLFSEKYKSIQKKDSSNKYESLEEFIKSIEEPLRKENKFQFIEPYMKWIVQRYVTNNLGLYEDMFGKTVPGLLKYDILKRKNKLKQEHKDVNKIKNLNHLLDILNEYQSEDTRSNTEKEKEIEQNFYDNGEAELIYNDSNFKIVIPKSERASCFFGKNTRWCTAATESENLFNRYNEMGNLYILIDKKNKRKFQFHFEAAQFMDEKDEPIDLIDFEKNYNYTVPILSKLAKKHNSFFFVPLKDLNEKQLEELCANYTWYFVEKINLEKYKHKNLEHIIIKSIPVLIDSDYVFLLLKNFPDLLKNEMFVTRAIKKLTRKSDINKFIKKINLTFEEAVKFIIKDEDVYLALKDFFPELKKDKVVEFLLEKNPRVIDFIDISELSENMIKKILKKNEKKIKSYLFDLQMKSNLRSFLLKIEDKELLKSFFNLFPSYEYLYVLEPGYLDDRKVYDFIINTDLPNDTQINSNVIQYFQRYIDDFIKNSFYKPFVYMDVSDFMEDQLFKIITNDKVEDSYAIYYFGRIKNIEKITDKNIYNKILNYLIDNNISRFFQLMNFTRYSARYEEYDPLSYRFLNFENNIEILKKLTKTNEESLQKVKKDYIIKFLKLLKKSNKKSFDYLINNNEYFSEIYENFLV
ncbi:MAG: hypothetical protein NZZ41_00540 [Candidatus Dojkabacteria bacterium]|nr:hypothetical protein [Candidatus Dojkabacteria bacterium]